MNIIKTKTIINHFIPLFNKIRNKNRNPYFKNSLLNNSSSITSDFFSKSKIEEISFNVLADGSLFILLYYSEILWG